jgi:hypothetical protein
VSSNRRKKYNIKEGRAIAQTVGRWLPTAAARDRVRAACEVCGGQSSIGAGFLRVLRFPLPIIHQMTEMAMQLLWYTVW